MLVLKFLGVFQRHVEEHPLDRPQAFFFSCCQNLEAQIQGDFIKGECLRRATKDVAGELVGEENEGELAVRSRPPIVESSFANGKDQRFESLANLVVDVWILRPPEGGTFVCQPGIIGVGAEPIVED